MSDQDGEEMPASGTMLDHIHKYRNYIQDLKQGKSSGISAAFGRASDLLPPDVLAISPPAESHPSNKPDGESFEQATVASATFERRADESDNHIGAHVETVDGTSEVIKVFIEDGERKFMLANLDVIDEAEFWRSRIKDDSQEASNEPASARFMQPDSHQDFDLIVDTPSGKWLWSVKYDELEVDEIVMADGSHIRLAEGRQEFVYVQAAPGTRSRIFILSGLVVDPTTGNIYAEANSGGYTAAFLNNGWQVHQYRSHAGDDRFYIKEPSREDRDGRVFEVMNLSLDIQSGAVTYETVDNASEVTLRSRVLYS